MNPIDRDALAARLLQMFVAELEDQVAALNRHLLVLEPDRENEEHRRAIFRVVHTLKGAARAAGVHDVENECHRLETLLSELRDATRPLDDATLATLFRTADMLSDAAIRLRAGQTIGRPGEGPTAPQTAATSPIAPPLTASTQAIPVTSVTINDANADAIHVEIAEDAALTLSSVAPLSRRLDDTVANTVNIVNADVRVRAEQLDTLLSAASRLLITSGRIEDLEGSLEELRTTLTAASVRRPTTSPAARITELENVLRSATRDITRIAYGAIDTTRALTAVTDDVAIGVRALRLRPFGDIAAALPRVVRDAALALGKDVHLEIAGEETQADRTVLDEMREAILHLVRNAVAHGIEPAPIRAARGKPATGTIHVIATVVADHVVVRISDDGGGIDILALRAEMRRRGEDISDDDATLVRRLFEGGVSTHGTVDNIAGRGVGLDAVRAAMARVRGTVDVTWRPGAGATFTLEAPVALATIRAVLVSAGAAVVAIPNAYVDRLVRIPAGHVRVAEGRSVITMGVTDAASTAPIPIISLARLLGPPIAERPGQDMIEAVILLAGERRLAVMVDHFIGEDEVVVRPIVGKGRQQLRFVSGAALLPSAQVALVANVGALVAAGLDSTIGGAPITRPETITDEPRRRVIVADDSITTRTLEQSVLETAGYEVLTAVDGADAWRLLQERGADLVVSDVEMPRMDGFGLCQTIRASARFRELPVVLVTALETPDDRARGIEAGADAYLAKSSFDQEILLDTIRQLIG